MSLLPQQFARREGGSTQLRGDALRLSWTFEDLPTSDSHVLRLRFACSAQIASNDADQRMFREVFLGAGPVASVADVSAHFSVPLRSATAQAAARFTAEQCMGDKSSELQNALASACKPIAFACGLEILPPFQIEIASPSLDRSRMESTQRAQAEQRIAGQMQHFQRAGEMLKQFQQLREQMPDLSPGEILRQMTPVDRGTTLQSLLMASANQARQQPLWAVAGEFLVRIDPGAPMSKPELIRLPTSAGPLRSVQPATIHGRSLLLVGARCGMIVVSPESPAEALVYFDRTVQTNLGFNRVLTRDDQIWASHGEAGVVGWKLGSTGEPFARFSVNPGAATEPSDELPSPATVISVGGSPSLIVAGSPTSRASGPRNLQALDAINLVYSTGSDLMILGTGEPQALPSVSSAEIVAILPDMRSMLVIHADSTIAVLSRESRQIVDRQRRAGKVAAAAALPWLGGARMLLVDTDGPIDCVGFDDSLITQYVSSHRGLRAVAASAALVAAVSSDRQRVILWQSWDGRAPIAEVHVTGIARHRVADVEFG